MISTKISILTYISATQEDELAKLYEILETQRDEIGRLNDMLDGLGTQGGVSLGMFSSLRFLNGVFQIKILTG